MDIQIEDPSYKKSDFAKEKLTDFVKRLIMDLTEREEIDVLMELELNDYIHLFEITPRHILQGYPGKSHNIKNHSPNSVTLKNGLHSYYILLLCFTALWYFQTLRCGFRWHRHPR